MLSPNANVFSTAAFDQLLSSGWNQAYGQQGLGARPQGSADTPVAKTTTPPAAPSTPQGGKMDQSDQPQGQPGAQPGAQPAAQPAVKPAATPAQPKGPSDAAAEIQEMDDVPGLIGMMHEIRSGTTGSSYPPEVVRSLTGLIQQRIARIQDREKQAGKDEQRQRWADQRTRDDLKREYPMWAAWKRSNPDLDVSDDLSFQAFEKEMANPESARSFRGFRRLSAMKSNIQNQQGYGAGRNAADVANTRESGKAVDELLTNIAAPEEHFLQGQTNLGTSTAPTGGNQDLINKGMRTEDIGSQNYALNELRTQKAANDAARATPQYQRDESTYRNLQKSMMNMGLSADVQMKMNSDIEKGLISPQDALRMIMMRKAGAKSPNQPQRQTVPPGLPKAPSLQEQIATRDRAINQMNDDAYVDALARGEITPELLTQYRMLTDRYSR
jgi:hypothetical protein